MQCISSRTAASAGFLSKNKAHSGSERSLEPISFQNVAGAVLRLSPAAVRSVPATSPSLPLPPHSARSNSNKSKIGVALCAVSADDDERRASSYSGSGSALRFEREKKKKINKEFCAAGSTKEKQKTGCPSLRFFFFPSTGVASARLGSFPWQQAFQTARRERWRAETKAREKGGGLLCRVLYFARRFPAPPRRPLSLGSVRRRANSAHAPTPRRLCIKCPTLCAAAHFFTAFPPYTSSSVILLDVLCHPHFWFRLRSFVLFFSHDLERTSFIFFYFSAAHSLDC